MLAEHVVYTQSSMQPVMSTHMLAFICLTLCRKGAPFREICQHYNWLKQQLAARNRDVGISGKTETIVLHAQQCIGDHLLQRIRMHTKDVNREEDLMITPNIHLQTVFELAHYSAPVTCMFAAESLIGEAHAIYAHVKPDAWFSPDEEIVVPKEVVIETAAQLCKLLKYEFIISPPCSTINSALLDAFDQLINSDILVLKEEEDSNLATDQKAWSRRFAASLALDNSDEEDDWQMPNTEYELCGRSASRQRLNFLRAVTAPLLETYYVTVCNLNQLMEEDLTENDFTKKTHQHLKDRVLNGTASYAESAGLDGLRNAIRGLQHMKVLRRYVAANVSMLQLSPSYKDEISIKKFLRDVGMHLGVPLAQ
ncbi:hypothetical protein CAPTEDRAFT_202811 [Capitella teleta]|uniref:GPAT/DHAPAT C-terminal domain-containing protein n=1 Tax=Capitella teleta TaxID=283909 RepID=R7V0J5_CAPTE|nr:hypothetical protein CAPTEDRAFT_202811 [Capitella teleta]|eukprot:ELU09196.1 hypothetical protein CAPTEDRAFT_202811 [Capitella teleta]